MKRSAPDRLHFHAITVMLAFLCSESGVTWCLAFLLLAFISARKKMLFISLVLTFIFSGSYFYILGIWDQTQLTGREKILSGSVRNPRFAGDKISFSLKLPRESVKIDYRLKAESDKELLKESLSPGTRCRVTGKLGQPPPANHIGGFDYPAYLHHHHIHWLMDAKEITCRSTPPASPFSYMRQLRFFLQNHITAHFEPETAMYINALALGERDGFDQRLLEAYQDLGLIHILAVSGLHISLIVFFIYRILIRSHFIKEFIQLFIIFIILPVFILLTGAAPSVLRAGIMAFLLLFPKKYTVFDLTSIDRLSAACILILLSAPQQIYSPGFQLSFTMTLVVCLYIRTAGSIRGGVWRLIYLSGLLQLAGLPLILNINSQISLISPLLNTVFVPYITFLVLPFCFIAVTFSLLFPFSTSSLDMVLTFLLHPLSRSLEVIDQARILELTFGHQSRQEFLLFALGTIGGLVLAERVKHHLVFVLPTAVVFSLFSLHIFLALMDPVGRVTFLDVGQGDSTLIELPHERGVYLIDTGRAPYIYKEKWRRPEKPFSVGKEVVLDSLKRHGIRRLDGLILTHSDLDHIGGALDVIGEVKIKTVYVNPYMYRKPEVKAILEKCARLNIPVKTLGDGAEWKKGEAVFKVVSPLHASKAANDQSVVLYVHMGGAGWLFTGDLEEAGEKEMIKAYPAMRAGILKVGHHGSKTSSSDSFLDGVKPALCIVSVGRNNRYGHPAPEVIERLQSKGCRVYRTDESGDIQITFKEHKLLQLKTARGKGRR